MQPLKHQQLDCFLLVFAKDTISVALLLGQNTNLRPTAHQMPHLKSPTSWNWNFSWRTLTYAETLLFTQRLPSRLKPLTLIQ